MPKHGNKNDLIHFVTLIIEQNEFKQDPGSVLVKVEQILGLDHYITSDMFAYNAEKGFYCIRSNLTTTE